MQDALLRFQPGAEGETANLTVLISNSFPVWLSIQCLIVPGSSCLGRLLFVSKGNRSKCFVCEEHRTMKLQASLSLVL